MSSPGLVKFCLRIVRRQLVLAVRRPVEIGNPLLFFAIVVALNQIGIAATLVNTLLMATVGALALAFGLAFGLGGRDEAARILAELKQSADEAAPALAVGGEHELA